MWSVCMEAVIEYCRLVLDVFPQDKLFRFVTCSNDSETLNSWSADAQTVPMVSVRRARSLESVNDV